MGFGDSAYFLRPWMIRPFFGEVATPKERAFNSAVSRLRVSVKHTTKN